MLFTRHRSNFRQRWSRALAGCLVALLVAPVAARAADEEDLAPSPVPTANPKKPAPRPIAKPRPTRPAVVKPATGQTGATTPGPTTPDVEETPDILKAPPTADRPVEATLTPGPAPVDGQLTAAPVSTPLTSRWYFWAGVASVAAVVTVGAIAASNSTPAPPSRKPAEVCQGVCDGCIGSKCAFRASPSGAGAGVLHW